MSKLAPSSIKYSIKAKIEANGVIERPDVIGAIFGQTEGLLGADLDLRELQRSGKIGRVEVKIISKSGKSEGTIVIPSALDAAETALVAATLETIERVGPCTAKIKLEEVEDARANKRDYVVDKAKDILKNLVDNNMPETSEISEQIKESVRIGEITTYHGLPCGPDIEESEEIFVVEGRADIVNLLKFGIRNTIAVEGTSIPQQIIKLTKEKTVTLFVDGDRGGQLIFKEISAKTDIDFVAVAPEGKEVEDLTKKEVFKSLRDKLPSKQFKKELGRTGRNLQNKGKSYRTERSTTRVPAPRLSSKEKELFKKTLNELVGTRAAIILDPKKELLGKVPVTELANTLRSIDNPYAVILDGKVDYNLNQVAKRKGIKFLVGMEKENMRSPAKIISREDLK
ncbi:MAG: DNA primase [Candidatus Aenigmarchaeota archaeon]|nr:DNA primase [Candidatus Aenigmarchaeota archaeon]